MADISYVFRTAVFAMVVVCVIGQFGLPGQGFGGNPGLQSNPFMAMLGGAGRGSPWAASAGGLGASRGGAPGRQFGFNALQGFQPPPPETTTPAPQQVTVSAGQRKLVNTLVDAIVRNHDMHVQQLREADEALTPEERRKKDADKRLQSIFDAANKYNAAHA